MRNATSVLRQGVASEARDGRISSGVSGADRRRDDVLRLERVTVGPVLGSRARRGSGP